MNSFLVPCGIDSEQTHFDGGSNERQKQNRMDSRDVESHSRLHQNQPRLQVLLRLHICRAVPWGGEPQRIGNRAWIQEGGEVMATLSQPIDQPTLPPMGDADPAAGVGPATSATENISEESTDN